MRNMLPLLTLLAACGADRPLTGDTHTPAPLTQPQTPVQPQPTTTPSTVSYRAVHAKDQSWNIGDDLVLLFKRDTAHDQCAMVELERREGGATFAEHIDLPDEGIQTNVIAAWPTAAACDADNVPGDTPSQGFSGYSHGRIDWPTRSTAQPMPCRLSGHFTLRWFGDESGTMDEVFDFDSLAVVNRTGAPDGCH